MNEAIGYIIGGYIVFGMGVSLPVLADNSSHLGWRIAMYLFMIIAWPLVILWWAAGERDC